MFFRPEATSAPVKPVLAGAPNSRQIVDQGIVLAADSQANGGAFHDMGLVIGQVRGDSKVDTITLGGTWAAGETATIEVNGQQANYTVQSGDAAADVADGLFLALVGILNPLKVVPSVSGAVVTVKSRADFPATIAVGEASSSGTIALANTQVASESKGHCKTWTPTADDGSEFVYGVLAVQLDTLDQFGITTAQQASCYTSAPFRSADLVINGTAFLGHADQAAAERGLRAKGCQFSHDSH